MRWTLIEGGFWFGLGWLVVLAARWQLGDRWETIALVAATISGGAAGLTLALLPLPHVGRARREGSEALPGHGDPPPTNLGGSDRKHYLLPSFAYRKILKKSSKGQRRRGVVT